jgi:hypothetical protein
MTKQDIKRDIEQQFGAFPSKSQIAHFLRKRREYVADLMQGIDPLIEGRSKKYYAGDVATRIVENYRG